jgi:hypothetical protein
MEETRATGRNSLTIMKMRRRKKNWYRARGPRCSEIWLLLTQLNRRRMRKTSLPMKSKSRIGGMNRMMLLLVKREKEKKMRKMKTTMTLCSRKTQIEKSL